MLKQSEKRFILNSHSLSSFLPYISLSATPTIFSDDLTEEGATTDSGATILSGGGPP